MTQIVLYFSSLPKIILHATLCAFLSIYNKSFSKKAILTLGGCKEIVHFYNLLSVNLEANFWGRKLLLCVYIMLTFSK